LLFDHQSRASTNEVSHFDRTIIKEPTYQSTPKYSLITLGKSGDVTVWMVENGRRLFVDKNANGDLTDDGSPIEPSNVRHLDAKRWDFKCSQCDLRRCRAKLHHAENIDVLTCAETLGHYALQFRLQ
jgi:ribosomal protein L24